MLTISHLSKSFGAVRALEDLNLTVKPGEIVALLGPNGSGKTTAVKLIAGLLLPSAGSVEINGRSIQTKAVEAKKRLGYIPDEPYVWPGMTGQEFLHFTGALYEMDEEERELKIPGLLEEFGLAAISQHSFEDYSRGNKQKFAMLAALLHAPKVLLVDEPIVGLDPASVITAERLFKEFADKGGILLLVTHSLDVAARVANRIGILVYGQLKAMGTLPELRAQADLPATATLAEIYAAFTK